MKKVLLYCIILSSVFLVGCGTSGIKKTIDGIVTKVIEKDQQKEQGFELTREGIYQQFDKDIGHIDLKDKGLVGVPDLCTLLLPEDHNKVYTINLMSNNIKLVDQDLSCLSSIKEINLSYNGITYVKDLGSLPSLETLQLHKNNISSLDNFPNFPGLKSLNLGYNKLKDISGLDHLINLVSLELVHNQIEQLVGIENLKNLEKLKVEYNKLKDLEGIEDLVKLILVTAKGNELKQELLDKIDALNADYVEKYLGDTQLGDAISVIVDKTKEGIDGFGKDKNSDNNTETKRSDNDNQDSNGVTISSIPQ